MAEPETRGSSETEGVLATQEGSVSLVTGAASLVRAYPFRGRPPRVENILVALKPDASPSGAIDAGAGLAERAGAKLSVVSVVEASSTSDPAPQESEPDSGRLDSRLNAVRLTLEQEFDLAGLKPKHVHVTVGNPAGLLAALAEESSTGLLVMGANRFEGFENVRAGSTGEEIIKRSRVPVLVATRRGRSGFRRILIATDLSKHSHSELDWACRLAWIDLSEVRVVHSESPWKWLLRWLTFRASRTFQSRAWQRFMGHFWELRFPKESQVFLRYGHAGRTILREARSWDADLIVMGVRRYGWPFKIRLGRATKYVLRHGGRSIVVVPSHPSTEVVTV